jgi:response regulator of citrate/malate metabolism
MPPTQRIVLVDGSRLLRGMLKRAIERDTHLRVVAEVDEIKKFSTVIRHANADWIFLILPPRKAVPEVINQTLRKHPELRMLVMSTDGSRVRMRWIETHETALDQQNLDEIMQILRKNENKAKLEKGFLTSGYSSSREFANTVK